MKKFVRVVDENGFFITDEYVEELTKYTIETPCPEGLHKPKWNGEEWVEGLSQEEINVLINKPKEPTVEERLQMVEDAIMYLLMGGM